MSDCRLNVATLERRWSLPVPGACIKAKLETIALSTYTKTDDKRYEPVHADQLFGCEPLPSFFVHCFYCNFANSKTGFVACCYVPCLAGNEEGQECQHPGAGWREALTGCCVWSADLTTRQSATVVDGSYIPEPGLQNDCDPPTPRRLVW